MNASVIICTRNRAASLDQTLQSLETISVPHGFNCEILVVDNGSTDGTRDLVQQRMARQSSLRYVLESSPGLSRARNAGLSHSTGEIIIFTDDDIRFSKDWLRSMSEPIMTKKGDAVAGAVQLAPHLERSWMTPIHRSWLASSDRLDLDHPVEMVGANMAFARRILDVVPSFDVELGAGASGFGEETLFAWQILKAGFRICTGPGTTVVHHFDEARLSRANWLKAAKNLGQSYAYLTHHWKHETIPAVQWRLYHLARYGVRRVLKWRECSRQEGVPAWEIKHLERLHRFARFQVECKRPRNYDRQGLVKLQGRPAHS